ncbi:PEP-CTERM sorting domain-containing protein [Thiohalocapsa sp. ML1]|uniref:PEP-CTERM sorting domain-containing protein n=1 Tax=Thiohalocapsa sp. ML1 TaxID=1431688 RepID=UPI0012E3D2C1|nr:PEP-CTERM sorting domain-containing protein [Thiohalocapsa sp. ML1]
MKSIRSLRALAAALALAGAAPMAQAGVFSATAFADIQLVSTPVAGVTLDWFNTVVSDDGSVSDPAHAFFDNDALLEDPSFEVISSTLTSIGDALAPNSGPADAAATLLTEASVDITNTSGSDVELEFSYLYQLFVSVAEQPTGRSTAANAWARLELFTDFDVIVDEIVSAALDGAPTGNADDSGSFLVSVANNETVSVWMFLDTGGDAAHVPVPASLPLLGAGLALVGLMRRRRAD